MSLSRQIKSLAVNMPDTTNDSSDQLISAIVFLLNEICLEDNNDNDFYTWSQTAISAWCDVKGKHEWVMDQCRFWGHQFCRRCNAAKYPEIPESCGECGELTKITEDQYQRPTNETNRNDPLDD